MKFLGYIFIGMVCVITGCTEQKQHNDTDGDISIADSLCQEVLSEHVRIDMDSICDSNMIATDGCPQEKLISEQRVEPMNVKKDYSIKEVEAMMDYLNNRIELDSCKKVRKNIGWFAIKSSPPRIEVALVDTTQQAIRQFKSIICDSPMITFIHGTKVKDQ